MQEPGQRQVCRMATPLPCWEGIFSTMLLNPPRAPFSPPFFSIWTGSNLLSPSEKRWHRLYTQLQGDSL